MKERKRAMAQGTVHGPGTNVVSVARKMPLKGYTEYDFCGDGGSYRPECSGFGCTQSFGMGALVHVHGYVQVPWSVAPRELPPYVCVPKKKKCPRKGVGAPQEEGSKVVHPTRILCGQGAEGGEEGTAGYQQHDIVIQAQDSISSNVSDHEKITKEIHGERVCEFFLQTGSCAFGPHCKFSHPIDRAPLVSYNSMGLPRRPGQEVCRFYIKKKRCAFGHTCKYDHPEVRLDASFPAGVGNFYQNPSAHGYFIYK